MYKHVRQWFCTPAQCCQSLLQYCDRTSAWRNPGGPGRRRLHLICSRGNELVQARMRMRMLTPHQSSPGVSMIRFNPPDHGSNRPQQNCDALIHLPSSGFGVWPAGGGVRQFFCPLPPGALSRVLAVLEGPSAGGHWSEGGTSALLLLLLGGPQLQLGSYPVHPSGGARNTRRPRCRKPTTPR